MNKFLFTCLIPFFFSFSLLHSRVSEIRTQEKGWDCLIPLWFLSKLANLLRYKIELMQHPIEDWALHNQKPEESSIWHFQIPLFCLIILYQVNSVSLISCFGIPNHDCIRGMLRYSKFGAILFSDNIGSNQLVMKRTKKERGCAPD